VRDASGRTARTIRCRAAPWALLIAAPLLLARPAQAQEDTAPAPVQEPAYPTALETYLERPGILLVKRRHPLAPIGLRGGGALRLDAVTAHEPGMQHQRVMGIRIEVEEPTLTRADRIFYIDVHEIEELVRAIDFMSGAMKGAEPAPEGDRIEMSISTRDGIEVGVRFVAGVANPFVRARSASFAVGRDTLEALRESLNRGREHLFSD
jgi:hypothetical protein